MKKLNFCGKSLVVLTISVLSVGCGSGGGGGGGSSQGTDTVAAPTVTQVTPPSGFVNIGSTTNGFYIDNTNKQDPQIAVPSSSGYKSISIPESIAAEIVASPSSAKTFLQHNILFQTTAQNVYWIDISSASSKISTKVYTSNVLGNNSIGDAQSFQYAVGSTSIIELPTGKTITYSVLSNNNGTVNYVSPSVANGNFAISDSDTANVCSISNQKITAVQTALFNNIPFLAIGTSDGTVCIDNLDETTGLPVSGNWQNLSAQADKKQGAGAYVRNPVTNFVFYNSNNNLFSYWSLTNPSSGIISTYRVTGTFNGTNAGVPSNYIPQGFINLGISQQQALLNGTPSVQINSIPTKIGTNPAISMANGNGYLCTVIGSGDKNTILDVYTFAPSGNTSWSNVQQLVSGDSSPFGDVAVQYGIDDACTVITTSKEIYTISPSN